MIPPAAFGEFDQVPRRCEAIAVLLGKIPGVGDELGSADPIDVGQRPAGPDRKTPCQDRTDICMGRIGDHALVNAACRFDGLAIKQSFAN